MVEKKNLNKCKFKLIGFIIILIMILLLVFWFSSQTMSKDVAKSSVLQTSKKVEKSSKNELYAGLSDEDYTSEFFENFLFDGAKVLNIEKNDSFLSIALVLPVWNEIPDVETALARPDQTLSVLSLLSKILIEQDDLELVHIYINNNPVFEYRKTDIKQNPFGEKSIAQVLLNYMKSTFPDYLPELDMDALNKVLDKDWKTLSTEDTEVSSD